MKKFGIRVSLPESSTLNKSHLFDANWEAFRWYDTAEARDEAFEAMQSQPSNYRKGDIIQQVLTKVEASGDR
ncbi:MAG: hypothetical protein ACWA44_15075 [Thiotrichales bacterium]